MPSALTSPIVVKIPLEQLVPNPDNPRRAASPEAIEAMAASLKAVGQQTPLKVRPLTPQEKQAHPGGDFLVLGGHIRLAGAQKAGLTTLQALVMDLTPDQAELVGLLDNRTEEMHWLDWDLAIQKLYGDGTKVSQKEIADQLGVTQAKISYALKVAGALTPAAQEMIYNDVIKSGPAGSVLERPILAMAALGTPQAVEKALPVVLERRMTEAQAKRLVAWVKEGKEPGEYGQKSTVDSPQSAVSTQPVGHQASPQPRTVGKGTGKGGPVVSGGGLFIPVLEQILTVLARRKGIYTSGWTGLAAFGVILLFTTHWTGLFRWFNRTTPSNPPQQVAQMLSNPVPKAPAKAEGRPEGSVQQPVHRSPRGEGGSQIDPQKLASWAAGDAPIVTEFAAHYYSLSYLNPQATLDYLKSKLMEGYYHAFIRDYFPPERLQQVQAEKLVQSFQATAPPKLLGVDATSDEFLVQGVVTTESLVRRGRVLVSKKPVGLKIRLHHDATTQGLVDKVLQGESSAPSAQGDPLKDIGDGVKNAADAVNTAKQGQSAVDGAKKLLGF